jgi:uncharacterized membrane protein YhhN
MSAVYFLLVIAFLIVRVRQGGFKALILKTSASLTFIAMGITALQMSFDNFRYGVFIVIGLFFGMLGDVFLDLKYAHKKYEEKYTFAGMISFLIGHLLYIVAILATYTKFVPWQIAFAIFCATLVGTINHFLSKKMGMKYGKFETLTFVYSITTMMTVTFSLNAMNMLGLFPLINGEPAPESLPRYITMFLGTALFAISDLVLSFVFFKEGENKARNVILNHTIYYTSQFVLVLSILM